MIRQALLDSDSPGETTYLVLFNAEGKWHSTIPGGTMLRGRPSVATKYVEEQLTKSLEKMKLPLQSKLREIRLPTVEDSKDKDNPSGVRLFVKLPDHEIEAYRVPVVKAIPVPAQEWNDLKYPKAKQDIDAKSLKTILRDIFPPAMKEMVGPNIHNEEITGVLNFVAAGSDAKYRYATLTGEVKFILAGRTKVTHGGTFEAVLKYPLDKESVSQIKAVFEGIYPETDSKQQRITKRKYLAVVE